MPDSRTTEERLRSWLDSNQVQRERLCAQLLSLLGQYSHVEPRRPKGGPDGARDIQAVYNGHLAVWGAVGFRNSAKDDNEDKNWVRKKFKDDLQAAQEQRSDLKGFVFFTNVDLTPGEQDELKEHAKGKGLAHIDIFIRERLRLVLDSIEGWGYRLQFLDIEMSREEQLAFFDRFGARLESLFERQRVELREQQKAIDDKLRRIEFLHDCVKPVLGASFFVTLKQPLTPEQLGHFRILLRAINLYVSDPHPTIWFGARDGYSTWHSGQTKTPLFGVKTLVWSCNPDHTIQATVIGATGRVGQRIDAWGHLYGKGPCHTLGDFDRLTINIYVTKSLVEHLAYVGFSVNNYLLIGVPGEHIATAEQLFGTQHSRVGEVEWAEELTPEEMQIEWVELCIKGPDAGVPIDRDHPPFDFQRAEPWNTDFEAYTPIKEQLTAWTDDEMTDAELGAAPDRRGTTALPGS
jgi:hypothetical protein